MLWDSSDYLEPEDGKIWILDVGDKETLAFTRRGIEALQQVAQYHIVELFNQTYQCIHAKIVTLKLEDMHLVKKVRCGQYSKRHVLPHT